MSILRGLFRKSPDYPPLEAGSLAARELAAIRKPLEELANQVSDQLEVIPSEGTAYVFVGKPPKKFGVAWIHDGRVSNFKSLVEEKGIKSSVLQGIVDELRTAYEQSSRAKRYVSNLGDKQIVVTPDEELKSTVHDIMNKVAA